MSEPFVPFSASHLLMLLTLVVFSILLYAFRFPLRTRPKLKRFLRYALAALLAVSQAVLDAWNIAEGAWSAAYTLPLELCSITLLLSVVMLLTRSRVLYGILFFTGIGGALQALVTPNLAFGYPHIRFFQFLVAHMLIILASLYMTWIEIYRPTWRSVGLAMIFLNAAAVVVGTLDYLLGANYMFLMHKPSTPSLLDYLGPHPFYLLVEEGIALLIFVLMHLVCFVLPEKRAKMGKSRGQSAM
ncbi:YwaF family protein [Paenibacillus cookii]|uniref:ABC transporter permease n=1 Tax=Paenibacillus cookii TaxID=157839 RepID=A0ABQ4LUX2_9BACL|nr:TIGR02206 family membrane protein [Paenibacillus cookii]GIO67071.1 ABC transporter permease [Paenibacillus cookii]